MDVQVIANFVSTIGFPIVACAAMFYMVRENDKLHREEIDGLRKALEANTSALLRLETIMNMLDRRANEKV